MVSKEELLEVLPPVKANVILVEDRQNTNDIRAEILASHEEYAPDYDLISHYFDTGDIVDTSRQIFEFLKQNVPYEAESGKYQTIKSPAAILSFNDGNTPLERVDCKNYASFIAGIIDSIQRNNPGDWDWTYRFASYDQNNPEPGHVFVVVERDGQELWIDPVFNYFNNGDMHEWELDEKPVNGIAGLYKISGPPTGNVSTVDVNPQVAWTSFLMWVQINLFAVQDLICRYPQILPQVKLFCEQNGFDFKQFLTYTNHVIQY